MPKCRKNAPKTVEVAQKENGNFFGKNLWKNQDKSKCVLPLTKNDEKTGAKSPKKTIYWGGQTIFSVLLSKWYLPPIGVKKDCFVKMWENRHKCTKYVFWRHPAFHEKPLCDSLPALVSAIDFFRPLWYDNCV